MPTPWNQLSCCFDRQGAGPALPGPMGGWPIGCQHNLVAVQTMGIFMASGGNMGHGYQHRCHLQRCHLLYEIFLYQLFKSASHYGFVFGLLPWLFFFPLQWPEDWSLYLSQSTAHVLINNAIETIQYLNGKCINKWMVSKWNLCNVWGGRK